MARKKPTTADLTEQAAALAQFGVTALIAADQHQVKSKLIEGFPLELTDRIIAAELPALPVEIKKKLAKKEARFTIADTASILMAVAESLLEGDPQKRLNLIFIAKKLVDCLEHGIVMPSPPTKATTAKKKANSTGTAFQFKITLLDIRPAIWRRIQVPDCTLTDLHEFIQAAFGWENYHLHQFEIDGEQYSQPAPDGDDMDFEDETDVLLSKLLPKASRKALWIYEYDFGDCWRHEVLFEGFPPNDPKAKPPVCLEGERACPPEDCGGPPGYAGYLDAIADHEHERHEEMMDWRGPFDPLAFDAKKATKRMRQVKP